MRRSWTWISVDQQIADDLARFVPDALFDAHVHLYRMRELPPPLPPLLAAGPGRVTSRVWRTRVGRQVGGQRLIGGLLMPYPTPGCDVAAVNRTLLGELDRDPGSRGAVIITPQCQRAEVEALLRHPQVVGLKPYHFFAARRDTRQARLHEFVPTLAWELAHERGLVIVLHLVRYRAWADPDNQRTLLGWLERYPKAHVQLAHAARGFHPPNTIRHLQLLQPYPNVWFDTSGICEPPALVAILRQCGHGRLLWGSDFPVSEIRGRCVAVGDGFVWLDPESVRWDDLPQLGTPTLVGLESLRALREACETVGLASTQVRDVFVENARRLLRA